MNAALEAAALAHVVSGPLDALIELGLPVILLVALWAWSARAERKRKSREQGEREGEG